MFNLKRAVSVFMTIIIISMVFTGCAGNSYLTVNGTGTSNSEFLFNLKSSMYTVMSSTAQSESTKEYWSTKVEGVSPFDKAVEEAVKTTTLYAVVDKKYDEYKLKFAKEQEDLFNQAYNGLISNFSSKDEYLQYIKTQGITDDDIKSILKRNVKQNQLKNYLFAQGGELYIKDEDIKKDYDDNYYRVKHILFLTIDTTTYMPLSEDKIAQAKTDSQAALAQLKNGADFDKLMREKTQDPGSLTAEHSDGYIFTDGDADKAFETASKALKVGQMSEIVQGTYGYHIIKKLDLNEKPELFESMKEQVLENLKNKRFNDLLEKWVSEAKVEKNEAKINSIDPVALLTAK